ncbi:galactokinase gal [Rickenella mellea]|uniref:Galactokinase n=1 Tax=Rickenella mellea TaxID=50990 RepID=A0A4Y7QDF8_9AGAM|nr:galactokinase gal [Rickenella mellea]
MAASQPIPVYTQLKDVFQDTATALAQGPRWNNLIEEFTQRYGRKPEYIARAPGRVNLIGEHIDYALFGVFPAAVERDILMAVAGREEHDPGRITADNLDGKYSRQTFAPIKNHVQEWELDIDKTQLRWESYVKAGYYGVLGKFFNSNEDVPKGVDLLVTGSVPAGSGLSSSAAMVVASTLSFLAINQRLDGISKGDLVNITVSNERRVGVNSGGMDQSASVISAAGAALYVSFFPLLSAEPIPLPITAPRSVFVCANSLVVSDKVVHAKTRYNLRVVETLAAARVLGRRLGVKMANDEKITMREVLDRWLGVKPGEELEVAALKSGLERISKEIDGLKLVESDGSDGTETGLTLEELIELSGLSASDFKQIYLSWVDIEATHFQLYKRSKHVFSEAWRVLEFRDICLRTAEGNQSHDTLRQLGKLMDESQTSCAELYECSCPELDELTHLAKEAGAYGSRLTGAGWGGCTVSLVEESRVEEFITKVKAGYPAYHGLHGGALHEVIFATKPSSGACLFKLT